MGNWLREQLARPRFRSDSSQKYWVIFEATSAAIRTPSWEAAHANLRPHLHNVLASAVADRYEELVKQLYVLTRMHGKIGYDRAHAKLLTVTEAMGRECGMPHQVVTSINTLFERKYLPLGVLEHVVEGDWTLAPAEVPACLNRFRWNNDAKREHMQFLLCIVLRAVADFRSEVQVIMELDLAIEVENRLSRAQERANNETQRAVRKHGHVLSTAAQAVQKRVESLVSTLSGPCVERTHLLRSLGPVADLSLEEIESDSAPSPAVHIVPPQAQPLQTATNPVETADVHDASPSLPSCEEAVPTKTPGMVVEQAHGLVVSMLTCIDARVDIIGSSLLYVAEDIDIIVTTNRKAEVCAALAEHLALVADDPPTLQGGVDGLHLDVQVLPTETTNTRLLQRKEAVPLWEAVARFTSANPAVVPYLQQVQHAFAARGMKSNILSLLPGVAIMVVAVNSWLQHKATAADEPKVDAAFEYLHTRLSFDPLRADAPPCVRLFDMDDRVQRRCDMPQMALAVLGSEECAKSMTWRMSLLTTRALHRLCADPCAFDDAREIVLIMDKVAAAHRLPVLLRMLDALAGDCLPVGKARVADAHSAEYVAAVLPCWRSNDRLVLRVHATSERRFRQLLDAVRAQCEIVMGA